MKLLPKYRTPSYLTFFVIALLLLGLNIKLSGWNHKRVIIEDVNMYYDYLPATIIEHDPLFQRLPEYDSLMYWIHYTASGGPASKMSMGVAYLQAPFVFLAHIYTKNFTHFTPNGFSEPYHLAVAISSIFYVLLGLFFLRHVLRRYFSEWTTAFTLLAIGLGTNLYYYSVYIPGMSHAYSFSLTCILLWLTHQWFYHKTYGKSFLIGLIFGMVVLIRPVNILFALPLLFLLKETTQSWSLFWKQLLQPSLQLCMLLFGFIIAWAPQLLFWKLNTGNFFYYSYREEGFFWLQPHLWEGLFSFRNGWLIYTPMILLSLFGIGFLWKKMKQISLAITVFLPLFLYVTFSWWCWWYGGSFSARTLVDILPFMALPLGGFFSWVLAQKRRKLLLVIPFFLVYLNLFQSYQANKGIIHYDSMTWNAYKAAWMMTYTPDHYWEKMQIPDYENAQKFGQESPERRPME